MTHTLDYAGPRREDIRTIAIAVAVSVLIHLMALLQWKLVPKTPTADALMPGAGRGPLVVQIVPPPAARPAPVPVPPAPRSVPRPKQPAVPPRRASKPALPRVRPPAPPVIALDRPSREAPPAPPPATSPPRQAPAAEDLSSYIASRRRAQADPSASLAFPNAQPQSAPEDANARANRLAAANLAPGRAQAFGYDPNRGGGIFNIQHVAYDYAEFLFYGWNRDAKRNTAQLIEVRKGSNPDIRIAIVRKMIAIIREHEQADFVWESQRLGRHVMLSARPRDNEALEAFMMDEFFDEMRRLR